MASEDDHSQGMRVAGPQQVRVISGRQAVRYVLGGLLAFGALNAFAGGYYGLAGAKGVPTEWLAGSPFRDYWIPSLILFIVVGGSLLVAAVAVFAGHRAGRAAALWAGVILLVWLATESFIIGYVSWMQPATAGGGIAVLLLAKLLPAPVESSAHPATAN